MSSNWTVTVVSDDPAWVAQTEAALCERGVRLLPLRDVELGPDRPPRLALILDSRLAPHGGAELGAELRDMLREACPPLLLADADAPRLTDEQRDAFSGVLRRTADPPSLAAEAVRVLSRPRRTTSGVVSRADVRAEGTEGTGTSE